MKCYLSDLFLWMSRNTGFIRLNKVYIDILTAEKWNPWHDLTRNRLSAIALVASDKDGPPLLESNTLGECNLPVTLVVVRASRKGLFILAMKNHQLIVTTVLKEWTSQESDVKADTDVVETSLKAHKSEIVAEPEKLPEPKLESGKKDVPPPAYESKDKATVPAENEKSRDEVKDEEAGAFVGETTWEERTWKEIVRLREEMFWARIGGLR